MTQEKSSNQQFRVFLRPRASYRTDYQTQFIRVCEQGACEHDILPLLKLSVGVKTATIVKATDTRTHELRMIVVLYVCGMTLQTLHRFIMIRPTDFGNFRRGKPGPPASRSSWTLHGQLFPGHLL